MKKIFTLLVSICLVSSIFAQYPGNQKEYGKKNTVFNNDSRYTRDDDRFNDHHDDFGRRRMEFRIADINRDYDRKIQEVRNNWFMNHSKKERIICRLEEQRRYEIRMVYAEFNKNNRNHFGDNDENRHW